MALFAALTLLAVSGPARAQPYAAVIMDVRTGRILQETDNANSRIHPASLTKMMTLYIAFEALENGEISLDTRVRISRHAASQPPSRLGLRAGQTIAFRYLIRAAALRSANDAAVAIAEAIEGSVPNFAERMNRTARAIGMTRTTFRNPHGLTTEGHLSSARDMSLLGRQLYFDYPQYYNIFSRRSEDAGIARVSNTNRRFLNGYRGADGIKTGFTNAAGYNLTAMAERGGVRVLVTVMGTHSSNQRFQRVTELMDRGFRLAPSRAAVRRPPRPDYVRAPEDRGSGPSAGRTIRLQTAPTTSRFPRARPRPEDPAPPPELLAELQEGIDEVLADIREPDPETDTDDSGVAPGVTSEEPEDPGEAVAVALAEASPSPERSPLPQPRPEFEAATVTRGASGSLLDSEALAELVAAPAAPEGPDEALAMAPFEPSEAEIAAGIVVSDGTLTIAGLPPIHAEDGTAEPAPEAPELAALAEEPGAVPADLPVAPVLEPARAELAVDETGRILWRDEELLTALDHEDPQDPVLAPAIVLTTSSDGELPVAPAPMPEIISRVSASAGRHYAVELGQYAQRFDADRVLLRLALSEAATLGAGERRVISRGGRFIPVVQSLGPDEAELACARLAARNQPCTVVAPTS